MGVLGWLPIACENTSPLIHDLHWYLERPMSAATQDNVDRTTSLSLHSIVLATLRHRLALTLTLAIGVATATAVVTGAFLVGDSMRGSLRDLTIQRLGRIESILAPGQFFPFESVTGPGVDGVAIILFPGGGIEHSQSPTTGDPTLRSPSIRRVGGVQIIGVDDDFWELNLDEWRPSHPLDDDSVILNASAADELGVHIGDEVTLRLPDETAVPADSPLGRREIRSEGLPRMVVTGIIPDAGLGRFSLSPNQAAPQSVFARRQTIADVLERDGQANAMLFTETVADEDIRLSLPALGWKLERITRGDAIDVISLTSEQLMLPEAAVEQIVGAFPAESATPVMTYLANVIERADASAAPEAFIVPYSTIAAMNDGSTLSLPADFRSDRRTGEWFNLDDPVPVAINSWTADRLKATVGTTLNIAYYEPEVERGKEIERSFAAMVRMIVPITRPARPARRGRPAVFDDPITAYNDPSLTPEVPGVTDQDSISDWDLPFALTREIDAEDDLYWNEQGLTPKLFLPLADGQRLFGSRFGQTTGLRLDPALVNDLDQVEADILAAIDPIRDELGWMPRHIREQQLKASRGTTPFDALFLSLSTFVIVSAVMLVVLLLRLGMLQRLSEFGTLAATGWPAGRISSLVLREIWFIAILGGAIGVGGGVVYARLVIAALRTWWVDAVTVPFLEFHASPRSLFAGGAIGVAVCMIAAWWTLRFLKRIDPAALLAGRSILVSRGGTSHAKGIGWTKRFSISLGVAALVVGLVGVPMGGQAAAGAFVGGGMLLLAAILLAVLDWLRIRSAWRATIGALALAGVRRNPTRSTLTIALVATAAFLILSLTMFRMSPTSEGTGGFELLATSAQPIHEDLTDETVRKRLLGRDADSLKDVNMMAWRMRPGDDASCNNLYQATRPTVLGIPAADTPNEFAWAAKSMDTGEATWSSLQTSATGSSEDPIPVVIDQNTAMWSLQMRGGVGEVRSFEFEPSHSVFFKVAGLLAGSVLQGRLMIGESNFTEAFPDETGYRFFMMSLPDASRIDQVAEILESRLSDAGMDVRSSDRVLAGLLAVQNTYLTTFQSLGALGLLLGTIGLAVAQLRNVLQRRGEFAVLRAIGFSRGRLAGLVLRENAWLLGLGIGIGVITAVIAVAPQWFRQSSPLPIWEPLIILVGIFAFGFLAGVVAVIRVATLPLIESLRADDAIVEI